MSENKKADAIARLKDLTNFYLRVDNFETVGFVELELKALPLKSRGSKPQTILKADEVLDLVSAVEGINVAVLRLLMGGVHGWHPKEKAVRHPQLLQPVPGAPYTEDQVYCMLDRLMPGQVQRADVGEENSIRAKLHKENHTGLMASLCLVERRGDRLHVAIPITWRDEAHGHREC